MRLFGEGIKTARFTFSLHS